MIALQRVTLAAASALIVLAAGPVRGQIGNVDRTQLGTRLKPPPPGEGGQLVVTAPARFCSDADYLLELQWQLPAQLARSPVVRLAAGPSICQWEFELLAGEYAAVILVQRDGRIVASARGHVARGETSVITLESEEVEVQGFVKGDGPPIATAGLRLVFTAAVFPSREWSAPLDAAGAYRLKLGGSGGDSICLKIQRMMPLNSIPLKQCRSFSRGLERFDITDVQLLPGVLRILVPPLDGADVKTSGSISVSKMGTSEYRFQWGSSPFKLVRGLHGDYFGHGYGDYEITLTSLDRKTVWGSARITLSPEHPEEDVKLMVTTSR